MPYLIILNMMLSFGCSTPENSKKATVEAPEVVAPQAIVEPPIVSVEYNPQWQPDDVFIQVEQLFALGLPNPYEIMQAYQDLYDEGGLPSCPGQNYNFEDVDFHGCYGEDDVFFSGTAEFAYDNASNWWLHCDCRIVAPDGRMVRGAGNLLMAGHGGVKLIDIRGSFLVTHGSSWVSQKPSMSFQVSQKNHHVLS